jgi:hypothetical protein
MIWSFSSYGVFRKCPRQWFYRKVVANSRAKEPLRQEAYKLSKLEGLQAWRGKIVDTVISDVVIPSINRSYPCTLANALRLADQMFAEQRSIRLEQYSGAHPDNGLQAGFQEIAYGKAISDEMFDKAHSEIHVALENFYKADGLWTLLKEARYLIPQRPVTFTHGKVSVRVIPDLIAFRTQLPPVVFDWKVNTYPLRDYWLQLVAGAIAITRCKPHRDWPNGACHNPSDIDLFEVQLLSGDVRKHILSEADVCDTEDFISISATEMELVCGLQDGKNTSIEDVPVASDPRTCQYCAFMKLCWEAKA